MRKTRYHFSHCANGRYYWYSEAICGDSRVEQVVCDRAWFWSKR